MCCCRQRESGQNRVVYNKNDILVTEEWSGGTGRKAQYLSTL